MKTKLKAILFIVIILILIGFGSKVQAASASISATKTSATVGDSVTITVSVNAAAWNLKVSGSGVSGDSIVGYDSDGNNTSTTRTFALNTSSAGTYTVYLSGDVTDGSTDANTGVNKSVTVSVSTPPPAPKPNTNTPTKPNTNTSTNNNRPSNTSNNTSNNNSSKPITEVEKKSNDASLKYLAVEGYELYPAFEPATKEYNLKVTNDITTINLIPTVNNEKANYQIEGMPEELQVGKNEITIVVTAEDGTTDSYKVIITKERETLKLQQLKISYIDEEGNTRELALNPELNEEVHEYTLEDISYLISKLDVEVLTNLEEAKIEIEGNEELVEGENIITIKLTMPSESEEEADEVLIYKITVNKEKEPVVTLMGKITNWFKGITGAIGTWYGNNKYPIVMYSLIVSSMALGGLSVYLIMDYKKYKNLLEKVAEITRINSENTNNIKIAENGNTEDIINSQIDEDNAEIVKPRGRHF